MENFRYKNRELEFWSVTGEVIGQNKYSETHISSSGGGGYINQHGGHISAPTISSSVVTNQEFWIRRANGVEKSVQLSGRDIPLRQGQVITLISAGLKGKDSGYYSILVNHNAKRHWFINKADQLNRNLRFYQITGKCILLAIAIALLISQIPKSAIINATVFLLNIMDFGLSHIMSPHNESSLLNSIWMSVHHLHPAVIGIAVAVCFLIIHVVTKIPRIIRMSSKLDAHLESLAQQAYKTFSDN